ncbi:hypothetical protein GE061_020194 [Apolygus lucorum]|uniref:Uncharacterized protein n=1 Tax=Apolygus lucorum TaxID=248454 RepID=A0A8S9WMC5_APOLU|nr:hypothetical protein GE061_020194 [Apolygus lucorum]
MLARHELLGQSANSLQQVVTSFGTLLLVRVIVTPAVYPRLLEFLHFDIQSTGQKSHCVNTRWGHRNALF